MQKWFNLNNVFLYNDDMATKEVDNIIGKNLKNLGFQKTENSLEKLWYEYKI